MKSMELICILDRSGSMAGKKEDTIGGYNAFLQEQLCYEGNTYVTTALFDDEYEMLYDGVGIKDAMLDDKKYRIGGCTALLDAIGKTLTIAGRRIFKQPEYLRPDKVMVLIMTDGLENASCEYSRGDIKRLIERHEREFGWEFVFVGAGIDAFSEAGSIGISRNNTACISEEAPFSDIFDIFSRKVNDERNK